MEYTMNSGIVKEDINFTIFCALLIVFMALIICSIGYKVFAALVFPAPEEENESRKNSMSATRAHMIRDNPFHDFVWKMKKKKQGM